MIMDFKIKFLYKGEVRTYRTFQLSEALALGAWRFYCIKKKLYGSLISCDVASRKLNNLASATQNGARL